MVSGMLLLAPAIGVVIAAVVDRLVGSLARVAVWGGLAYVVLALPLLGPLAAFVWGPSGYVLVVGVGVAGVAVARYATRVLGRDTMRCGSSDGPGHGLPPLRR
jgi:hypothetical protein